MWWCGGFITDYNYKVVLGYLRLWQFPFLSVVWLIRQQCNLLRLNVDMTSFSVWFKLVATLFKLRNLLVSGLLFWAVVEFVEVI